MSLNGSFWRIMLAVVCAAILSSLLISLGYLIFLAQLGPFTANDPPLVLLLVFSFYGLFPTVLVCGVMATMEWPKARRLIHRKQGGALFHFVTSALAVAILPALFVSIGLLFTGDQNSSRPFDYVPAILSVLAFAVIGLCSALCWWWIVIQPGRRRLPVAFSSSAGTANHA